MSTTDQRVCACGEPLTTPCEIRNGICLVCVFSPPERTPEPLSTEAVLAISRKWFLAGKEAAFREMNDDGHIPYHDLVAREQRQDAEADLVRVRCPECGSHWLLPDAPESRWICDHCREVM